MSRQVKLRFAVAILMSWIGAAWWAAMMPIPETNLIGLRKGGAPTVLAGDFAAPDVGAAARILENSLLWGILRDGKPIPPPVKEEEARKKVEWRLVATAIRPKERYILIQAAGQAPATVKEGEALPDGSRLLKVEPKSITLRLPDGKKHRQPTVFD